MGIIGESGSGKSTLVNSLLNLLEGNWRKEGIIEVNTSNLALIPQDYYSTFNPLMKIKEHLYEIIPKEFKRVKQEKALEILKRVEIENPLKVLELYPHELSGGMLQRVNIALALLNKCELIIADECTSSLDSMTQSGILKLLKSLKDQEGETIILVSHDLNVIKELADEICVMYRGEIIEYGRKDSVLFSPKMDYTRELIKSSSLMKKLDLNQRGGETLLKVNNLYKRYSGNMVLKNINFDILKNQSVGVVGKSGSGKSTLAKILVGIEEKTEGEILFKENRNRYR